MAEIPRPNASDPRTAATLTASSQRGPMRRPYLFDSTALAARLAGGRRIASIDMLRGLAVVLMVLDHARFYFSSGPIRADDLADAPALFFAGWLTQLAAPAFVFLAGLGAYLRLTAGQRKRQVAVFLALRGMLLIGLDLTIVPWTIWFAFDQQHLVVGQLWAIGWSMIALAGLVFLRVGVVAVIGMAIVFMHNALDGIQADRLGALGWMWNVLHEPGVIGLGGGVSLELHEAVLPWIGVIACGFALGELYCLPDHLRRAMLLGLSANLLVTFLLLRGFNIYGDPVAWLTQDDMLRTMMSFLNCSRWPPSLCFLLMSLVPTLAILAWFERPLTSRGRHLTVFGSVPLYCYLLHWPVLHLMAVGMGLLRNQPIQWLFNSPDPAAESVLPALSRGAGWQPQFGVDLPAVLLMAALALVVLYPGCRRYAQVKFLRRPRWASYF